MLTSRVKNFVVRVAANFTARQNILPESWGKTIAASELTKTQKWMHQGRILRAFRFGNLTLVTEKPGSVTFECVVIFDPLYKQPLVLATHLPASAHTVWQVYRDRWAMEQLQLAAKPMLGSERAFVFGTESRFRLPELALLAGNVLAYVAAHSEPIASGFWDRAARPTCGRRRRVLFRQDFSLLPCREGKIRKKNSVTAHLKTGIDAHRRKRAVPTALFTGN